MNFNIAAVNSAFSQQYWDSITSIFNALDLNLITGWNYGDKYKNKQAALQEALSKTYEIIWGDNFWNKILLAMFLTLHLQESAAYLQLWMILMNDIWEELEESKLAILMQEHNIEDSKKEKLRELVRLETYIDNYLLKFDDRINPILEMYNNTWDRHSRNNAFGRLWSEITGNTLGKTLEPGNDFNDFFSDYLVNKDSFPELFIEDESEFKGKVRSYLEERKGKISQMISNLGVWI